MHGEGKKRKRSPIKKKGKKGGERNTRREREREREKEREKEMESIKSHLTALTCMYWKKRYINRSATDVTSGTSRATFMVSLNEPLWGLMR